MKVDTIICYYDEIALKGRNRHKYEDLLVKNIRTSLKPFKSVANVTRMFGRIAVELRVDTFEAEKKVVFESLQNIFGIAHFTPAYTTSLLLEDIKKVCLDVVTNSTGESFKIIAKRSNKKFPLTSMELAQEVGGFVYEKIDKKVKMVDPEIACTIFILEKRAHVSGQRFNGLRGMPVGTSSPMLAMLSGGIDSPVSVFYMLKRGAPISFIHFHNYPYTSQASIDKVVELAQKLTKYQPLIKLYLVPFSDTQNEIARNCPEKLRVILYRRFMYRIAEKVALREKMSSLVTGEALGQVASQTIENITATGDAITLPIMRPLIGFDKYEIMNKAKQIDTYNISIQPHEDCCARFVPDHPETKAKLDEVRSAENLLPIDELVDKALEHIETKKVSYI